MEFINPPGRAMDARAQTRNCVCSSTGSLHNSARNYWGVASCNNCNCQCSNGIANRDANFNRALNSRQSSLR